jgi:hypothetical protein
MKRVRITVAGLMTIVAVIAVDLTILSLRRGAPTVPLPGVIFGAILMTNVLAAYLATTIGCLRRRGEVRLSRVMFLLFGGMALVMVIYVVHLAPLLVVNYLNNTAGLWERQQGPGNAVAVFGVVGSRLVEVVLLLAAVTMPILVPALAAAWAARGYRLSLVKGTDAPGQKPSGD